MNTIVIVGREPLKYDTEDNECARIGNLEGDVYVNDGGERGPRLVHSVKGDGGLFVRIQSWDDKHGKGGGHRLTHELEGKMVRVTIEVEDPPETISGGSR